MRLFVTGGTGFVGSHFVEQALALGCEVTVLRRNTASRPRIPLAREPRWLDKGMDQLDANDFVGCDVLVHLAAHTPNVPYDTLENCLHWNLMAPLAMMRAAQRGGVERYVVAGTCFEYGRSGERYDFIPTEAPLEPTLSYPASKAAASVAFAAFAAETKVRMTIQRIFQVYGEGEAPERLWPTLRRAAPTGEDLPLTAGEQVRDFVCVEDVASRLLVACADESLAPGRAEITNLGSGHPQSIREFAERWWRHWGATGKLLFGELPYRAGEVMRYVPQVQPAKREQLVESR
jgi:nucleoside-diphosphate-sugar epimerase